MKADTYIEFQKINARIDKLTAAWKAFLDQEGDKKAMRSMTADVKKQTKTLEGLLPAAADKPSRRRKS